MNIWLQLLIALGLIAPAAWFAYVQWHRMKAIDAIKPERQRLSRQVESEERVVE